MIINYNQNFYLPLQKIPQYIFLLKNRIIMLLNVRDDQFLDEISIDIFFHILQEKLTILFQT